MKQFVRQFMRECRKLFCRGLAGKQSNAPAVGRSPGWCNFGGIFNLDALRHSEEPQPVAEVARIAVNDADLRKVFPIGLADIEDVRGTESRNRARRFLRGLFVRGFATNDGCENHDALLAFPDRAAELPPSTAQMETSEEASISDYFSPITPSPDNYAKDVKVHYSVADKNFTLVGKPDSGKSFSPITSSGEIKVSVDPAANAVQFCDNHARYAFMEMISLLLEYRFVDFPAYSEYCRENWDPQRNYQKLTQFESLRKPNLDRINTKEIIKLLDQLEATTELFAKDSEDHRTLEETKEYVRSWSSGHDGDYHKGLELGKKLKAILDRLRRLHEEDPKLDATRTLASNRLDVLIGVVPTSWPSGRNCKAPMLTVIVTP